MTSSNRGSAGSFESVLEQSNLTRRQLLIYVGQALSPGVLRYDAVLQIRLTGIDREMFERAFGIALERCDALRTVISEHDGVPVQRVLPKLPYQLACIDLRDTGGLQSAVDGWIEQRCKVPFDLARQLFDTALLRTAGRDFVWFLNLHHLVANGWALELLVQTVLDLYQRLLQGRDTGAVHLPSFHDHVLRERLRAVGPEYRSAQAFWRDRLAQPTQAPDFYGFGTRHAARSGRRLAIELDAQWIARLHALAGRPDIFIRSLDATLTNIFSALLFAFAYRVSGQRQMRLGVAFHNRVGDEQKHLVGLLMEVLPICVSTGPEEPFAALVRKVSQDTTQALVHRHYAVGNPIQAPVYDMFMNPIRTPRLPPGQGPATRVLPGAGESSVSLTLLDAAYAGNLRIWLDVRTDLHDAVGGDAITGHFRTLLEAAVAHPDRPIGRLPILTAEQQQQVVQWNRTRVDYPDDQYIHTLFEAQAARSPRAIALVCGEEQLTYDDLERRANRLANHLRALGVESGMRVGICMTRSPDMIVALLAILKAGAAYVPLDPAYPVERLGYMLDDSGARLVVTQHDLRDRVAREDVRLVIVDRDQPLIAQAGDQRPADVSGPLAYVIYTSGSTGQPNGVLVGHPGVCNYLNWRGDYFGLGQDDALLQTASISFDDSVWEIFEPLSTGARLVLVDAGHEHDLARLVQLMIRHRITAACFVPSLLQAFLDQDAIGQCGSLRRMTTGGEVLSPQLQRRFFERLPAARLYNGYGPTEATISATFWACQPDDQHAAVPIGRPIANMRAYVLDHDRQPAPVGVTGELYLAGVGLAYGYLNQPQLTAERFVADPFSDQPGARLYRTGDLGRWLPDGNLDFVGRRDQQVKLRGFRIELGDVEAALGRHPAIGEAVVVLREDPPGARRLVAYYTARADAAPTVTEWLSFLGQRLPRPMIPAQYVQLDRMPLSPNGRIDRAALPAPEVQRPALAQAFASPRTPAQRALAEIWQRVLGIPAIGLHDNFFDLGGDSLLAIKLLNAIDGQLGRTLGIASLFDAPTIEGQTLLLQWPAADAVTTCAVAVQATGSRPPIFFVSGFGGALLSFHALAKALGPEQPLYVLDLNAQGELAGTGFDLPQLAARMLADLRAIQTVGPYHLAGFSLGGKYVWEIAGQLLRAGDEVALLALLDCAAPGYPRLRAFPMRAALHVRHALGIGPHDRVAYLLERVRRLQKYFRPVQPQLFRPADGMQANPVADAIEAASLATYRAWCRHEPGFYPGRLTLIRATIRMHSPGAIDDDPQMGWGGLAGQGVDVAHLDCGHTEMLDAAHAPALARLLEARIRLPVS